MTTARPVSDPPPAPPSLRPTLHAEVAGTRARVRVGGPAGSFAFEIDVGRRPVARMEQGERCPWSMVRGLPISLGGVFLAALQVAREAMHACGGWGPDETELARAFCLALRGVACELADACDPDARRLALRFRPGMRFEVYRRLVGDRTGRVAQLASCAPGTLLFALALLERRDAVSRRAGRGLLRDVVRGRPLDRALDACLELWEAAGCALASETDDAGLRTNRPWVHFADASEAQRRILCGKQRLLVRRAGFLVAPTLLWLPPPVAFLPEDVPAKAQANARWFRTMKGSDVCLHAQPPEAVRRGLSAFLSANSEALRRVYRPARLLMPFLAAGPRVLARRSSVPGVLEDQRRWQATRDAARLVAHAVGIASDRVIAGPTTDVALPPGPPGMVGKNVVIRQIATVRELSRFGARIRNCLGNPQMGYLVDALKGRSAIYEARIAGAPLAVRLVLDGGCFSISGAAGLANREPTSEEMRVLRRWVDGLEERRSPPDLLSRVDAGDRPAPP